LFAIVGFGVELEDFDNEGPGVFDEQVEFHRFFRFELSFVGVGEVQIDPLFELLKLGGRK